MAAARIQPGTVTEDDTHVPLNGRLKNANRPPRLKRDGRQSAPQGIRAEKIGAAQGSPCSFGHAMAGQTSAWEHSMPKDR